MKFSLLRATCALLMVFAQSLNASFLYLEDFESGLIGSEWSTNVGSLVVDTAPAGQKILGKNDVSNRGLSNQSVTLSLTGLPSHSQISIIFDLIIIDSMDGARTDSIGMEPFTVAVDGNTELGPLFFMNRSAAGGTFSSNPAVTGSPISLDTHGYTPSNSSSRSDAVYRIALAVPHVLPTLSTSFTYSSLQALNDESWSIDNINVSIIPIPATVWLLGSGLLGFICMRKRKKTV